MVEGEYKIITSNHCKVVEVGIETRNAQALHASSCKRLYDVSYLLAGLWCIYDEVLLSSTEQDTV